MRVFIKASGVALAAAFGVLASGPARAHDGIALPSSMQMLAPPSVGQVASAVSLQPAPPPTPATAPVAAPPPSPMTVPANPLGGPKFQQGLVPIGQSSSTPIGPASNSDVPSLPGDGPPDTKLPNFYEPPETTVPVQQPSMDIESADQSQNGQNGQQSAPPLPPGVSGADFSAALAQQLPMTPQEIIAYRQLNDQVNRARSVPIGPAPKADERSIMMSLSTAQAAPLISMYPGNATTLTFADNTGAPWPIDNVVVGDPKDYSVIYSGKSTGGQPTNILVISPLANYTDQKNLIVNLKDSPSPLVFNLRTGADALDYRVDVNLEAAGPNAAPAAMPTSMLPPTQDTLMQQFVDNVPPPGAKSLRTSSADVEAWNYRGHYFLRTDATLMSFNVGDGNVAIANSVSGTHVYKISPTPTITVSENGALSIVTIDGSDLGLPNVGGNLPDETSSQQQ